MHLLKDHPEDGLVIRPKHVAWKQNQFTLDLLKNQPEDGIVIRPKHVAWKHIQLYIRPTQKWAWRWPCN